MGKEDEVTIGGTDFDIIRLGDTYKHELSAEEREELKEDDEGQEVDSLRKSHDLKLDVTGNIVFSKPHTGPEGIHVDLKDEAGHKVGALTDNDLVTTASTPISGSIPATFPYPTEAKTHTVGVYGADRPGTITTDVGDGTLQVHATASGTIQVAFW